jgi:hypothetical protein
MLYSILVRRLAEGVEFEQFREAWLPDPVDDGIGLRVVHARSLADPREVVSIGFMALGPDEVEELGRRTEAENERRHERFQPLLEGERRLIGVFEQASDDEIAL